MKKNKPAPKFRKEQDEREFWTTHDTTDYFDYSKSNRVEIEFDSGVEAPVKSISLRLPRVMLNQLKVLVNKKDIPYQSLIKVYLAKKSPKSRKQVSPYASLLRSETRAGLWTSAARAGLANPNREPFTTKASLPYRSEQIRD